MAIAFLALGVVGLGFVASYFSRYHSDWREAIPEAVRDVGWLPLMAAAWWIKIRVEDWLDGAGFKRRPKIDDRK